MKKSDVLSMLNDHELVRTLIGSKSYTINGKRVSTKYAESLIKDGFVKIDRLKSNGISKHYYVKI